MTDDAEPSDFDPRTKEYPLPVLKSTGIPGVFLCCDCGFTFQDRIKAKKHEADEHLECDYRAARDDDRMVFRPRWMIIYDSPNMEHPKVREGRLRNILHSLRAAGGVADAVGLSDRTGMSREELEPYLEELEREGVVEGERFRGGWFHGEWRIPRLADGGE